MLSFEDLNINESVMKAIKELGYEKPSPIQQEAFPILLGEPTDFIGLAATGTGKTAAFSIPMLQRLDPKKKSVQALILCPTRELALQVSEQVNILGKYMGVRALPVYGGSSYVDQMHGFKRGDAVVVGTPGRVIDHMERGTLKMNDIKVVILDEADEMISMGFKEELDKILGQVPKEQSKIWLFSATLGREVRRVAQDYLTDPQQVQINKTEMLSQTVEQIYYVTQEQNKPEVICKLIDVAEDFYGIIFCQTKALVSDLSGYLAERGYKVDSLHGDKDQKGRERTMTAFRDRKVNILVCTDVASRGLDVKDITHVINYSLPRELDSYVHRIGRTARSGKAGLALSLVTRAQRSLVGRIENLTKSRMTEGTLPSRKDIGSKKVSGLLEHFSAQKYFARASETLSDAWKESLAKMDPSEIAGRFISLLYPDIFNERDRTEAPTSERVDTHPSRAQVTDGYRAGGNAARPDREERRTDRSRTERSGSERPAYRDRAPREDRPRYSSANRDAAPRSAASDAPRNYPPRDRPAAAPRSAASDAPRNYPPRDRDAAPRADAAPRSYASRDKAGAPRNFAPRDRDSASAPKKFAPRDGENVKAFTPREGAIRTSAGPRSFASRERPKAGALKPKNRRFQDA